MNTPRESREILKILGAGRSPEDEARLALAYEKFAKGDPDSLPSLFTLMDMNSLRCHAALLEEQQRMLASFTDVAGKMAGKALPEGAVKAGQESTGSSVFPLLIGALLGGAAMYFFAGNRPGFESNLKHQSASVEYKETVNTRGEPVFVVEIKSPGRTPEAFISASGSAVTVIPIRK